MGSVDKAAIVWTIAIVIFGAGIAVVGSSFDQADSKQDMAMMDSMNDDKMMMQDNKMTDMEKMMDNDREMTDMEKMMDDDRESSSDNTTEKMMDEKMTMEETGPVTKSVSIPSGTSVPCEDADKSASKVPVVPVEMLPPVVVCTAVSSLYVYSLYSTLAICRRNAFIVDHH